MIGRTVSHYLIVERLGRGAMGMVYKAQDQKLDRPVAIKFISRDIAANEEQRARFVREARTASLLDHPTSAPFTNLARRRKAISSLP